MADDNNNMNQEMMPEQPARRKDKNGMPWMGGVVLIIIGVVFLLRQLSGFRLDNWWALFILIPAVGSFSSAWREYEKADRKFTATVRGSLIGGLIMVLVAVIFLFNLNWALFFPAILILSGIGLLASSFF